MTKLTLTIEQDEDPQSPRDWTNLGKIVAYHRRYRLGDKDAMERFPSPSDFKEWMETKEGIEAIKLPIFMYDHSGISLSTDNSTYPFNCHWDSGKLGYIYVTMEDARKSFPENAEYNDTFIKTIEGYLQNEIKIYNQYVSGEVYCFVIKDESGDIINSCGGFFGYEDAEKEGNTQLKHFQDTEDEKEAEKEAYRKNIMQVSYLSMISNRI